MVSRVWVKLFRKNSVTSNFAAFTEPILHLESKYIAVVCISLAIDKTLKCPIKLFTHDIP